MIQRAVYGVEQRQIAQLGTTAKVALRKHISVITMVSIDAGASIPESPGLHAQVASYKVMSWFELGNSLVTKRSGPVKSALICPNILKIS